MARERDDEYDDDRDAERPRRRRPAGDPALGRQMVRGPGMALIVYGVFSVLLNLGSVGLLLTSPDTILKPLHDWLTDITKDLPKPPPGQPAPVPPYDEFKQAQVLQSSISGVLGVIVGGLIVAGGAKLRATRTKGLAMTGSILSMIFGGCCCIGLPIGIWAVVVMGKPDVKAAFAASAAPRTFDDLDDRG